MRQSNYKCCKSPIFITLFLLSTSAFAQSVANYSVNRTTGISYNSIISTGNSFASWRNTGGFSQDDNRSDATNIGFDFWYNGQRFTQFSISANGYLDFSNAANNGGPQCNAYGYCNNFFSASGSGTWLALAPFYDDLTTRVGTDPLGTSMKYQLSGSAPNRVLTVEWDAMAAYANTSPDLNFQVKLYETTGVIEFNYETMNTGTSTFSYTVGINAVSVSNPPVASELNTQQTANTSSFGSTAQDNLITLPTANSQLRFTPPTATTPSGTLTISGVTRTGMTLNWPNWATNEIGYALYSSIDNVNFTFNSQTLANATSAAITGLSPSTIYYWRVYAVTEGGLSSPLSANATTLPPGTIISVASGRWDVASTWDCVCVPTAGDNAIIRNGHIVTLQSNTMQCNDLTVGQGVSGVAQFTTNTARTLTINGNLIINNGASVNQAATSNAVHTINFGGNITNNGTLNLLVDGDSRCNAAFTKINGDQTVSGVGTTGFYTIAINKNSKANILEITTSNFTCDPDALSFTTGGTFKFSSSGTNSFSLFNTVKDIPLAGRIWMNSANSTMNFGASLNLRGDLRLDNGIVIVGNAANENINSIGGNLEINGGAMRIAGRYVPFGPQSTSSYVQTAGTLTLPTISSTSTTQSPFSMEVAGSSFTMTGGTIILQREGGTGTQNLGYNTSGAGTNVVTGGTLQVGDATTPAGQTLLINSGTSIGNLLVSSANATGQLINNNLNVISNITLTSGTLNDNGRDIILGGNWLATGGIFTTSVSSTTTFNGGNQSVTTAGSAFNNLTLSGSGTKSFQDNLNINNNLTFSTSFVPVNSGFICALGGNWTNNGSFTRNNETTLFNGVTNQIIAGSSTTDFTNITVNKSGGSVLVNGTANLYRTLTIQSATIFDADGTGGGVFTIISTDDEPVSDGRVATLPGTSTVTGNVTVQRYTAPEVSGATRVYRYITTPVSGQFVSDWQDDFPITGRLSNPNTDFPIGSGISSICGIPIVPTSPSLYGYVETNTGTGAADLGWIAHPASGLSSAASLQVGRGYAAFIRDCTNPTLIDVRGPINQGTISFNSLISRTINGDIEDGLNLVGNPYPSAIDWNTTVGWTRTGISSVIYIKDNGGGGGFITYDYTDNIPLVIAMGQAFWVRVTGTPTFSINEQAKTGNAAIFYRTSSPDKLTISLTKDNITDKAVVKFNPQSIGTLDDFDGPKLDNSLFDVSTLSEDGISMAVNSLNKVSCGALLPMKIKDMTNGEYQFSFERLGEFEELNLQLFDRFTDKTINLFQTQIYTFIVNNTAASKASDRFELRFDGAKEIDQQLAITGNSSICRDVNAKITVNNSQPGVDYYVTLNNLIVSDSTIGTGHNISLIVGAKALHTGANQMVVIASDRCLGKYKMNQQLEIVVQPSIDPKVTSPLPQCKQSNITFTVSEVPTDATIQWYDSLNSSSATFKGEVFTTPLLSKSRTYYTSVVSAEGCEGNRIATEALILSYTDATISVHSDTLISNYKTGNQWYRDDQIIPNATSKWLVANASGIYRLKVQSSENCTTSANISMVITGHDEDFARDISIYPNPVRDIIEIKAAKIFDNTISIIDNSGRTITTLILKEAINDKFASYDVANLSAGIYFIKAIRSGNPVFLKIVKY